MSLPAPFVNHITSGLDIGTRVGLAKLREGRHDIVASRWGLGPCHGGETAHATGTSTFMSANRTLRATLAPASRQTRTMACSAGGHRGRTPEVAQAARWSPKGSSCMPSTAASARREREGMPQAAQQENTKRGTGYRNIILCERGERPSLRPQQRSRSRCKVRKVHLVRAFHSP